jgi:hypothetical protein
MILSPTVASVRQDLVDEVVAMEMLVHTCQKHFVEDKDEK